jgi:lipoteichoic acid synthase
VAPGVIQGQFRTRKVVSLVDTTPTILDLLGIPAPENYQGQSMLESTPRMALFFADYSLGMLGLRDGPWKFIYGHESGRSKMFDLDRDARERTDLSTANHERATRYGQIVRGWSGAQISYVAQWDGRRGR